MIVYYGHCTDTKNTKTHNADMQGLWYTVHSKRIVIALCQLSMDRTSTNVCVVTHNYSSSSFDTSLALHHSCGAKAHLREPWKPSEVTGASLEAIIRENRSDELENITNSGRCRIHSRAVFTLFWISLDTTA